MAASDFDYAATRNDIIKSAYRIVGAIEAGEDPTAEQLSDGITALQLLVKSWANKHVFLWNFNLDTFSTVSSQVAYTSVDGVDITLIGLDKAWVVIDSDDVEIEVITYSEYLDIPTKADTGKPLKIAIKRNPAPTIYLWPVPDAVYTIKTLGPNKMQDFSNDPSGTANLPAEFQRALKYGLAEDLFDEYPGPMNEREYIQGKAASLFIEAKNMVKPTKSNSEIESLFPSPRCR